MADHEESINCMCLSEDGSMLVTGSEDATARLWATRTEETECLGVLKGHSSYINCVAMHDTFVITGGADSTIRKWDMTTCACLSTKGTHPGYRRSFSRATSYSPPPSTRLQRPGSLMSLNWEKGTRRELV